MCMQISLNAEKTGSKAILVKREKKKSRLHLQSVDARDIFSPGIYLHALIRNCYHTPDSPPTDVLSQYPIEQHPTHHQQHTHIFLSILLGHHRKHQTLTVTSSVIKTITTIPSVPPKRSLKFFRAQCESEKQRQGVERSESRGRETRAMT